MTVKRFLIVRSGTTVAPFKLMQAYKSRVEEGLDESNRIANILVNDDAILQKNRTPFGIVTRMRSLLHEIPAFHNRILDLWNFAMSSRLCTV